MNFTNMASFIWAVADLLRGDYKQADYGKVILPFTLLRRLECVLDPTKQAVYDEYQNRKDLGIPLDAFLTIKSKQSFYNISKFNLLTLLADPANLKYNLESYIDDFSDNAREIFERYKFNEQIAYLDESNLLYQIVQKFSNFELHPDKITNHEMGLVFEELIRRFAEASNETAGEHFTPRDVVRLTTSLLFSSDDEVLSKKGIVRSLYDPTAGTGGFLSSSSEYIYEMNPDAKLVAFGQELNPESYAICKADMLIKGQEVKNIKYGNTLSDDQLHDEKFDYALSNPPFGVSWDKVKEAVEKEHKTLGFSGRFGAGLPRVSDGSLLFLLHLVSKMRPVKEGGGRVGIILNGSPLFTGGAGSGESEIRRYILENDLLEAIVALPTDMFFNTGIATYVWILSNKKEPERKNRVQLIDATEMGESMRKSLGSKRKQLSEASINEIVGIYGDFEETEKSKIFDVADFGYRRVTVERPLQVSYFPTDAKRVEALKNDNGFKRLKEPVQTEILTALSAMAEKISSVDKFEKELTKRVATKLTAANLNLIRKHLAEQDEDAELVTDAKGNYIANPDLRDYENIPLKQDVNEYFEAEVKPHLPLAWIDEKKTDEKDKQVGVVGYEISFNRYFYKYAPPRPLEEIDAELNQLSKEIMEMLNEI